MKIGFIGGGTMAEAILGGMLDGGVAAAGDVMIGEPVPARRDYLAERYGVGVSDANGAVVDASDLTVMAVKPQDLPKVYADIGGRVQGWPVDNVHRGRRQDEIPGRRDAARLASSALCPTRRRRLARG